MSLTFTTTTTAADRVAADLLAVAVAKGGELGPDAAVVDAALDGGLADVPRRGRIRRARWARRSRCRRPASCGPRPRSSWGSAIPPSSRSTACAASAPAIAEAASKVTSVATTVLDAAPALDPVDAAQALAEGMVLGAYQFLEYQPKATPTKLARSSSSAPGGARVKAALARGAVIAGRRLVGARHDQPPVEGEAPRRIRGRGAQAACAAPASPSP